MIQEGKPYTLRTFKIPQRGILNSARSAALWQTKVFPKGSSRSPLELGLAMFFGESKGRVRRHSSAAGAEEVAVPGGKTLVCQPCLLRLAYVVRHTVFLLNIFALFLITMLFLLTRISLAEEAAGNKVILPPEVAEIKLAPEIGRIIEYHQGTKPLTIYYIQDAHVNIEAQKCMSKIVETLHKKKDIRLILVEGGIGDVSLTEYRVGPKEKRQKIADDLLREGKISGEEYLNFIEDYPLLLWGIESQVLYDENLIAYTKVEPLMPQTLELLKQVKQAAETLKPQLYSKDYLDFEKAVEELTTKHDLHHEAKLLLETAGKKKIPISDYPNLNVLASLIQLEAGADFEKIDYERTQLVQKLQRTLAGKELRTILSEESSIGNDHLKRADFYEKLIALAEKNKIDMAQFPALKASVSYLREQDKIDSIAFFNEKEKLEERIAAVDLTTGEAKKLYQISKDVQLLETLVKLELIPDHYQTFVNERDRFRIAGWEAFLTEQAKKAGKTIALPKDLKQLDETIDQFQSFYRIANIRDQALVENLTEKIREEREPESILIAGGFHKDRLIRKLLRIGFNVVVISPNVGLNQGPELYRKMLKEKWENGRWYIKGQTDKAEDQR